MACCWGDKGKFYSLVGHKIQLYFTSFSHPEIELFPMYTRTVLLTDADASKYNKEVALVISQLHLPCWFVGKYVAPLPMNPPHFYPVFFLEQNLLN